MVSLKNFEPGGYHESLGGIESNGVNRHFELSLDIKALVLVKDADVVDLESAKLFLAELVADLPICVDLGGVPLKVAHVFVNPQHP